MPSPEGFYRPKELNADNAQLLAEAEAPDRDAVYWKHQEDKGEALPADPNKVAQRATALERFEEQRARNDRIDEDFGNGKKPGEGSTASTEETLATFANQRSDETLLHMRGEDLQQIAKERDRITKARTE